MSAVAIKERPILFKGEMVRAIQGDRKTQTRRAMKLPSWSTQNWDGFETDGKEAQIICADTGCLAPILCPYGKPGDRLAVVELRHIPESPNFDYMAGSDGNIYSRTQYAGFGRKHYVDWYPLKGRRNSKGYKTVCLCHENKKVTKSIHRLICSAFYGAPSPKTLQVRHLDGDPENNKPENLAWGTQFENWQDRKAHGNGCEGEKHHGSKFSDEEREHIRWAVSQGLCSGRHAANVLGVSPSSISQILNGLELKKPELSTLPRYQSITLEVTDVRVERLQDITEEDAIAEGIYQMSSGFWTGSLHKVKDTPRHMPSPIEGFKDLWNSINSDRGYGWDSNPFVWCVSFKQIAQQSGGVA